MESGPVVIPRQAPSLFLVILNLADHYLQCCSECVKIPKGHNNFVKGAAHCAFPRTKKV